MQGAIQSMRAERGFGFLRDIEGTEVFFNHSVVTPSDRFVTLVLGMAVEFEAQPGPKRAPRHEGYDHACDRPMSDPSLTAAWHVGETPLTCQEGQNPSARSGADLGRDERRAV